MPDRLLSIDRQWTLMYVNAAAADTAGQPPEDLVGQPLLSGFR
ncbi:PAS domain-containing protein [Deinococcus sp.]